MSKKIKKLLIAILSIMAFVVIGAIGVMGEATTPPPSIGINEVTVPVSLYTQDSNLVKTTTPTILKKPLQALSQTNIPFEVLDFTNKQTDSINGYENYSFYATNDPTFVNKSFAETFKWFGKAVEENGVTISDPKSRLSIAKLYKVTPGSILSFLIAEEDVNNSGGALADARILFAEYDANLKLLNDGAWISAQQNQKISTNTHYVAIIIRYQNGNSAIGSGTETTVGWGTSGNNLNLGSFEKKDIIFKPFLYSVDRDGDGVCESFFTRYGVEDVTVSNRDDYIENTPSKIGYTFTKWIVGTEKGKSDISSNWKYSENINKLKGIKIVKGETKEAYYDQYFRDLYFTAVYEPNSYKVHYNANGGTGTMASDNNVKYDASYTPKANTFAKTGYKFAGWYDNAACTGTKYSSAFIYKRTSDLTLYAKWEPNNNTISFNSNGGTGSMSSLTVTYDKAYTLPANTFTRTGYTFLKWNTNSAGTGTVYTNKQSDTWKGTSNITLYAQWSANPYKVHYNANGGTGTMASDNVKYDASYTPKSNTFTKVGYKFAGWYDNAACTGTKYSSAFIYKRTSDLTLYAKWEANDYKINYYANGGTGTMTPDNVKYDSSYILKENTFERIGYTFINWNTESNNSGTVYTDKQSGTYKLASNLNLYAQWSANPYRVHYNANGGTGTMASDDVLYDSEYTVKSNEFEKTGYYFAGWYENTECSGEKISESFTYKRASDLTLYAKWLPASYVVTLNSNRPDEMTSNITFNGMPHYVMVYNSETNNHVGTVLAKGSITHH